MSEKLTHFKVTIDEPLIDTHWGGFRDVVGYKLEMAAEVINLQRSIVIWGDDEDFLTFGSQNYLTGWHMGTFDAVDHGDSVFNVQVSNF